jgi:hypothetical protein
MFGQSPEYLASGLFAAGVLSFAAAAVVCGFLAFRFITRGTRPPTRDPQDDFTNMLMLFQTMRDILEQQKDLARDLNKSLDRRVAMIREDVTKAQEDMEGMHATVRRLSAMLENTERKVEPEDLRLTTPAPPVASAPPVEPVPPVPPSPPSPNVEAAYTESPILAPVQDPESQETEAQAVPSPVDEHTPRETIPEGHDAALETLRGLEVGDVTPSVMDRPDAPTPPPDLLDAWVGLDVGPEVDHEFDVPEELPVAPDDGDSARQAFRTLLNLEQPPLSTAPEPMNAEPAPDSAQSEAGTNGSNGSGTLTPLQRRVYEYKDAGMAIQDIARELGVGKGEIRLILSLRKDKAL